MSNGVVAVGDSITNSCGFPAGNLPLATWSEWVARALGEPVRAHARSGANSAEIRVDLLSEVSGQYRLGLVYAGTNDMLQGRRVEDFADDYDAILARVADVSDLTLTLTLPLWVGRVPTIAPYGRRLPRIHAYSAAIRDAAGRHDVVVVQAPEIHGPRCVAADRVHPTAVGQLAYADAVAWRLRDLGWELPMPSSLVMPPDPVTTQEWRRWASATVRNMAEAPLRQLVRTFR